MPEISIIRNNSRNAKDRSPSPTKTQEDLFSPIFDFHLLDAIAKGKMSLVHKGVNLANGRAIIIKYSNYLQLTF